MQDKVMPWFSERIDYRLLSCHGNYMSNAKKWCNYLDKRKNPVKQTILLDSGAFTAWTKGHEATLSDLMPRYEYFLNNHLKDTANIWLINLDKIPASPGRDPTPDELAEAIEVSDRNFERLVAAFGERVLPVFHQGEDDARLNEVVAMSDYICVSPRNDLGERFRVQWSAETHAKLPAGVRTHGLAATGVAMMEGAPWTSVDSATLMFFAASGLVRAYINGSFQGLAFTEAVHLRKEAGKHYDTMTPTEQAAIREFAAKFGFPNIDILRTDQNARAALSLLSMNDYIDNYHRFKVRQQGTLFA